MKPGSPLRQLMGLEGEWSRKIRHIEKDGDLVHIHYDRDDAVYFIEDFSTYIRRVKSAYGNEIHGELTVAKLRGSSDFLDLKYRL